MTKAMEMIEADFADPKKSRFATTRKLMTTGDPEVDYYVAQFWETVANTNIKDPGISENAEAVFLAEQALRDVRIVFAQVGDVWSVNIYNYLYGENVTVEDIDEVAINRSLYDPGLPDVDLIIRTSGEQRLSNFLIWQGALWAGATTWTSWRSTSGTAPGSPQFDPADPKGLR